MQPGTAEGGYWDPEVSFGPTDAFSASPRVLLLWLSWGSVGIHTV